MSLQPQSAASTSPWAWARVIYVILALAAFCFPGGLVDWLDERNATGWLAAPLALAHGIDGVSTALGVKPIGQMLRKRFAAMVGDSDS